MRPRRGTCGYRGNPVRHRYMCALPAGHRQPHRFIQVRLCARVGEERALRRYGYTTLWGMVKAIAGRVDVTAGGS